MWRWCFEDLGAVCCSGFRSVDGAVCADAGFWRVPGCTAGGHPGKELKHCSRRAPRRPLPAATRLLDQTTFGPTFSDIQHVEAVGLNAYLTEQFNASPTTLPLLQVRFGDGCYASMMMGMNGFFSTIMKDVTLSPGMGLYLNMLNSYKPGNGEIANENYARELLQLFTVGLVMLNPDGTRDWIQSAT